MKKLCSAAFLTTILTSSAIAGNIPIGVQNDVDYNTVLSNWGWEVIYRGDYSASGNISDLFPGVTNGDYLMLAAIEDGSSSFDILAAALFEEVTTYTPYNTTHTANGSEWYYNGGSMGFAGLGDTIVQSSADINGSSWDGSPEDDRLSWHTADDNGYNGAYTISPTSFIYGWRSGVNIGLNDSTNWDRVVLKYVGTAPVPEPSTMLLFSAGILGLAGLRRKRK